ncbi:MAG: elongation factor P hydroxylase [Gammaproteobacteria bacterium]|nr:elongation factor P hydroxylase [Gammaproteobacteria bacterium]
MLEPCVYQFSTVFNAEFQTLNTQLAPGANEPFYQAPKAQAPAIIFSNQDFFSSALHEVAHWCIAGEQRRQLDDYGYWYAPDGRSNEQQTEFFKVEVKPQALEWAFHLAANLSFQFSLDNLNSEVCEKETDAFKQTVYAQLQRYFVNGFPERALQVIQMLASQYNSHQPILLPPKLTNDN